MALALLPLQEKLAAVVRRRCHDGSRSSSLSSGETLPDPFMLEAGLLMTPPPPSAVEPDGCMLEAGLLETPTNSGANSPSTSGASSPRKATSAAMTIRKRSDDQAWGIVAECVSGLEDRLLVVGLAPDSAHDDYTKASAPGAHVVGMHDIVTSINGMTECTSMLRELASTTDSLHIEVSHLRRLTQVVARDGRPLGLVLGHTEKGSALVVTEVAELGFTKLAGYDIKVGDLILGINGKTGKARDLMQEAKASSVLELSIGRVQAR